ncbi:trimeric intracellular cation channel family protein [Bailinhaonella thermotolerans]|uniref:Trimeric intracellular cation channel family protein n=1 Tax=Bailinhaonella thermotolerans TaxID=1070861 RepID=A0A3A4B2X2_9ACTN|nr:trimeric intracellular cation channel family protein [Bailinhaonella thermotolerans]RJL36065.1 trimeric intracellular cation channel family protein [Bailinhaonella thermotolerans]
MTGLLDLAGIFVFAISGALAGVRRRLDVVGMAVLAEITALGGGILRDVVIGATPPVAFTNMGYVLVPLAATVIAFFWHPRVERVLGPIMVFDAAGLGLFCAVGTQKALDAGLSPVHATLLGVITAVGGGVLRDILSAEIPALLYDRQLYALPALLGSTAMAIAYVLDSHGFIPTLTAAVLAFTFRILAMRYGWRAPLARGVSER